MKAGLLLNYYCFRHHINNFVTGFHNLTDSLQKIQPGKKTEIKSFYILQKRELEQSVLCLFSIKRRQKLLLFILYCLTNEYFTKEKIKISSFLRF